MCNVCSSMVDLSTVTSASPPVVCLQGLQAGELLFKSREWLDSWAEKLLQSKAPKLLKGSGPAKYISPQSPQNNVT